MAEDASDRRSGGQTVMMRIVLDRPPDPRVLWAVAGAVRSADEVVSPNESRVTSPGFEVEVTLRGTSPDAVADIVLPRLQSLLKERHVRLLQIDGEDVLLADDD